MGQTSGKQKPNEEDFAMGKVPLVASSLLDLMMILAQNQDIQTRLFNEFVAKGVITQSDIEILNSGNKTAMMSIGWKLSANSVKAMEILNSQLESLGPAKEAAERLLMALHGIGGAYQQVMNSCKTGGGPDEGCGCMQGGSYMLDIQKYDKTMNAAAKEKIIDGVIDIMRGMGFKEIRNSGSKAEVLESILKAIPNREKNRKSFAADASKHAALCKKLAVLINKHFDNVIALDTSPELMCHQVSELLYSLFTGVHAEFVGVAADVRKSLMNLRYVRDLLREQMDMLLAAAQASKDPELQTKTAKMRGAYELLQKELDRQMALLQGLLNVNMSDHETDIASLLKEQSNLFGLIEKFDKPAGSALFSDYLSNIMTGIGITAQFARVVDDALKTVGMSLSQYVKDENPARLFEDLAKLIMDSSADDAKKEKMIMAAEFLRKNFYQSKDIEKKLKELKSGSSETFYREPSSGEMDVYENDKDSSSESSSDDEKHGGDIRELWESQQGMTMDRRVRTKAQMKNLMFRAFNRKLTDLLDEFVKAVCSLVGKIGTSVPVSDQLEGLRQALTNLDSDVFEKKNMYLSLVGYWNDAVSLQHRQTFVAQLDVVKSYADTMLQMSAYASCKELRDMSSLIGSIKQLLDEYSDKLREKYGMAERTGGGIDSMTLSEVLSGGDMNRNLKSAAKLKDAVGKFGYYYKAADIRSNLARSGKEIEHYGENYDDILGSAIAREIDEVRKSYYSDDAAKRNKSSGGIIDNLNYTIEQTGNNAALESERKLLKIAIKLHEEQMKCRINLWRTIEAVDQYLRYFTKGLVENPEDVKDIVSMIEDVSVIREWYDNESGDALCRMFDSFSETAGKQADAALRGIDGEHYYNRVSSALTAGNKPGNPFLAISVEEFVKDNSGQSNLRKSLSNMKALKNLTAVFAYIGEKFGSSIVHKETFMTPTQIYKSLLGYIECSAYMVGIGDLQSSRSTVKFMTSVRMRGGIGLLADYGNKLGASSTWTKEDNYFAMLIKCMCAKVLTVVGMYDLFKRPSTIMYINPVRMILGASDDVKIETKAVELYVRLPLLVEFYRELFGFESSDGYMSIDGKDQKFAMLPDMEGLFGGIINLMFKRNRGVQLNTYSDDDLKALIREINIIYAKMESKSPSNYVKDTINELVQEVNRRYGLMLKDTRDNYLKYNEDMYSYAGNPALQKESRMLDLDILPEENDYEMEKPAPSRKYERVADPLNPAASQTKDYRFEIKESQQQLFYKFRCMLDNLLVRHEPTGAAASGPALSFKPSIKSAMNQLARVDRSEERFKIVANLMRGGNLLMAADKSKYLLFHETVVSGLNVLSAIHTILARVRLNVLAMSVVKEGTVNAAIEKYFGKTPGFDQARITDSDYWIAVSQQLSIAATAAPIDYQTLFNGLLSTVFGVSKDLQGLVEVKVDDRIYINWGGLKKTITEIFTGVKYFMDLLRPHLENDDKSIKLISQYSDKNTPGSYYYLQERLMEQLVIGRQSIPTIDAARPYMSLDDMSKAINDVYSIIMEQSNGVTLGGVMARKVFYDASENESGLKDFKYGANSYQSNSAAAQVNWLNPKSLEKLLVNVQGGVKTSFPGVAYRYKHFYDAEPEQQLTDNRSLMFAMNQLIARFLYTFMDHNTNKIYVGCIDGLINGVFNSVITQIGQTFPDCNLSQNGLELQNSANGNAGDINAQNIWTLLPVELGRATSRLVHVQPTANIPLTGLFSSSAPVSSPNGSFGQVADPKNGQILFTSLAVMLYNIMSSKDAAGNSYYIERDLTAVPAYMKEKFRANMPGFANLFKELLELSELYKSIVNNKKLALSRAAVAVKTEIDGIALQPYTTDSVETKKVLNYVLTDISRVASAMVKTCGQIMREVADDPKHFETSKGSIEDFKNLNHKLPFMPVSNTLYVLHNTSRELKAIAGIAGRNILSESDFLPFNNVGDSAFKMAYGTRGVLGNMNSSVSMKSLLGLESLITDYNSASDAKLGVSTSKAEQFFQSLIKGLRYCHDVKNLKGAFIPNDAIGDLSVNKFPLYISGRIADAKILNTISMSTDNTALPISYMIRNPLDNVLALSESSQVSDQQDEVIYTISQNVVKEKPTGLRIQNILDMNIVPINVNAMMRELPLVNLYNYSYTFDRMIVELFYGVGGELGMDLIRNLCNINVAFDESYNANKFEGDHVLGNNAEKSSAAMFISLLVNPYKAITSNQSLYYLTGLMVGDQDSRLSRPKYLSDQLYGKALFGSLYTSDTLANTGVLQGPQFNNSRNGVAAAANEPSMFSVPANKAWLGTDDSLYYLATKGVTKNTQVLGPANKQYGWANIKKVGVGSVANMDTLRNLSKQRLHTVLVRNLMLIVNAYRALRLKIANDYNYNKATVARGRFITQDELTEFSGNQVA
jgi:hypothetical protein